MFDLLTICIALYSPGNLGPVQSDCIDVPFPAVLERIHRCINSGKTQCVMSTDDHNRVWFHVWEKTAPKPKAEKLPKHNEV